jgi:hypothetical protein
MARAFGEDISREIQQNSNVALEEAAYDDGDLANNATCDVEAHDADGELQRYDADIANLVEEGPVDWPAERIDVKSADANGADASVRENCVDIGCEVALSEREALVMNALIRVHRANRGRSLRNWLAAVSLSAAVAATLAVFINWASLETNREQLWSRLAASRQLLEFSFDGFDG